MDSNPSTSADRPDLRPATSLYLSDSDSEIIADKTDFSYSPSNSGSDDISSGNEQENSEPMSTATTSKKLTRKRKKNPSTWKRNFQKNLRLDGKQYYTQTGKLKPAKEVKDNIACHCHYNCSRHFSKEDRSKIFKSFTKLRTQQLRWNFIAKQVSCIPKKRCYSANTDRRANTYVYRLTSDQMSYQVCKKFFIATINVSSKTVQTALSKQCDSGIVEPDMRGKKNPPQKKSEQVKNIIRDHIKSIPVVASHYCRSTTKRKYLPQGLSETRLYEDYKRYCEELNVVPEKFSYYRQIFVTEFNLGFFRPKKDQCDFCTKFEGLDNEGKLSLQEQYNDHIKRKQESRDHKQSDKERSKTDSTFVCYTMDMEKILITPSLNVGKLYYTQKLRTYNFTVYDLSNSEATNYMWHEGTGAKGSSEIATCLWKHISTLEPSVKEVTFYSDTAAGQNRNVINAAMFLKAVSMLPIDIVNQKYMESGHSEMECDSVHSAIETRGTKVDIYTPEGWYTVVRSAKTKKPFYKVVELNFTDFLNYKYFSTLVIKNRNKNEAGETVSWLKIKWLQYRKEDPTRIFYKERLLDLEFKSILVKKVPTRMKSSLTDDIQALYTGPLPIEKRKLDGLVKLCDSKCIPETYHTFYKSLRSANEIPSDSSDEELDS